MSKVSYKKKQIFLEPRITTERSLVQLLLFKKLEVADKRNFLCLKIVFGVFSDNLLDRFVHWPADSSLCVISFVKSQQLTKSEGGCLGRGIFLPSS
jgi:hypothetical protein